MLNLDDKISLEILNRTDIFENVHPNYVTSVGFIVNFIILYYLVIYDKKPDNNILLSLLFVRWITDCLDGNIARKYKKTSEFGNKFDGISDLVFNAIMIYYFCLKINNRNFSIILMSLMAMYIFYIIFHKKIFETHENIKNGSNIFDKISAFIINNSFMLYAGLFFAIKNIDEIKTFIKKIEI